MKAFLNATNVYRLISPFVQCECVRMPRTEFSRCPMPTELCPAAMFHHVHQGSQVISTPPGNWVHWPSTRWRSNPLSDQWQYLSIYIAYYLYMSLTVWCKKKEKKKMFEVSLRKQCRSAGMRSAYITIYVISSCQATSMRASPQIWRFWAKCARILEGWTRRMQGQSQNLVH